MRYAVSALLFLFLCNSFAQDDAVVIEATRFPEDVRRLPASVTVISEDDIARSAARTLPELLSGEAGITMKDFYGNNAATTSIDLRGYGVTGPQNTLILLDGRRLNDFDLSGVQWSAIPLSGIERIEILRGTGAVLYGDAASAGVVNIVTRSPLKQDRALELLGRVASYNTVEGQAYGSAASGSVGLNGSVYGYTSDGYRAHNRNEQQNSTLNVRWALGEGALDLRFGTDRQDLQLPGGRRIQASAGLNEYVENPRGAATPLDYASRDGKRAGASFLQRFGDVELSVGADYRNKDQRSYFDQGGFPVYRADDVDLTSLTPRLRVPFRAAGLAHRLIVGVDWNAWRYHSRRTNRPENLGRPINVVNVSQDTTGWYLQDAIELARATLLTLGWRSERAKYSGDDQLDPGAPGFVCFTATCQAAPFSAEQSERAWEIGLRRALDGRWTGFARVGRTFRLVNAEEVYEFDATGDNQFQLLRPQHARTYEAGLEWRTVGRFMRATLFRSDVSDEIHLDAFTAGVGNTNLPPSRRQGFELDWKIVAMKGLQITGGYAYTEAKFLEGVLPGGPFVIASDIPLAGKTVPLVPRHKLNLGSTWELMARTRLSAALTAVSSQVLDNDELNTLPHRIPAYSVLDLKLSRESSWGRLSAAISNVFDKSYYTYAVRSQFVADRYDVYPLPGRTLSLVAELKLH
jgi:iron complex outermembrane recepter protein